MRGADVSSDHHLLVMTGRLRLKKYPSTTNTRTRYNVGLLKNRDNQSTFQLRLTNRFQILQDTIEEGDTGVEDQWNLTKGVWKDTCEEGLGKRETAQRMDFFTQLSEMGNTEVQKGCAK